MTELKKAFKLTMGITKKNNFGPLIGPKPLTF
jgi:hypothetical protein